MLLAKRAIAAFVFACISSAATAMPITLDFTTSNGMTSSGVGFTITNTGSAARNLFGPGASDSGTFQWSSVPEFSSNSSTNGATGQSSVTVQFDSAVAASEIAFFFSSLTPTTAGASVVGTFSVGGGTATTLDFGLSDGVAAFSVPNTTNPNLVLDVAAGTVTGDDRNQSLILGSTSSNTLDFLEIRGFNSVIDGYNIGFATTRPAAAPIPEPASLSLLLAGLGIFGFAARRRAAV